MKLKMVKGNKTLSILLAFVIAITSFGLHNVKAADLHQAASLETGSYVMKSTKLDIAPETFSDSKVTSQAAGADVDLNTLSKWTLTVNGDKVKLQDANGKYIGGSTSTSLNTKEYEWTISKNSDGSFRFITAEGNRAFAGQRTKSGDVYKCYALSNQNGDNYAFDFILYSEKAPTGETEEPQTPPVAPSFDITPIDKIWTMEQGSLVGVEGTVISKFGAWGGSTFYIQDESGAGIYVYPQKGFNLSLKMGDVVTFQAKLGEHNKGIQLTDLVAGSFSNKGPGTLADPLPLTLGNEASSQLHIMYKLDNVVVNDLSDAGYKTAEFTATDASGKQILVRLDNRSGYDLDKLSKKIGEGDTINVTGILTTYQGKYQLLPFDESHFTLVKKSDTPPAPVKEMLVGEIQGPGYTSEYVNKNVKTSEVVVTYVDGTSNFYVQDINPDNDPNTSNGILVYKADHGLKVGEKLKVTGKVKEFYGQTYDEQSRVKELPFTEIAATSIEKLGTAEVPAPIQLTDALIPRDTVKAGDSFDPTKNSLDFWESIEGMLVTVKDAYILGPQKYGDIYILPGDTTETLNKLGGYNLKPNQNPNIISVYTGSTSLKAGAGDRIMGDLTGVVSYRYSQYKILSKAKSFEITKGNPVSDATTIVKDPSKLLVASYNIENFTADKKTTNARVAGIAESIVKSLMSPDIITVVEMQDNDGENKTDVTAADKSAQRLIDAIVEAGGPTYLYAENPVVNNANGGAPGANIRVGFLYDPTRVQLKSLDEIGTDSSVFAGTRKSIVGNFVFDGHDIMVIGNHLNSKSGDQGIFGINQPPVLGSVPKRIELAKIVNAYVAEKLMADPKLDIVVTGDMNEFEFNEALKALAGNNLINLVDQHLASDRFSYYYQGNSQTLDHMLVPKGMIGRVEFDMVHVNSLFMDQNSDHDPILAQISFIEENEEPEQPGDEPQQPGDQPEQPGESEQPSQPGESEEPSQPGESEQPSQPGDMPNVTPSDKPAGPQDEFKLVIIKGVDSTWSRGEKVPTIVCNGDFDKLTAILFDGKEVSRSDMTLVKGSTELTFNKAFLAKQADGTHKVTFVYGEDSVSTNLTIANAMKNVKTGDSFDFAAIALVVLAGGALILVNKKKRATR